MNRNEEVGFGLVGDFSASLEWNVSVILASENHLGAWQVLLNDFAQAQGHIEAQIFFHQAGWPDRAGVVSTLPCSNHDPSDLDPQVASQGLVPVAGQLRTDRR